MLFCDTSLFSVSSSSCVEMDKLPENMALDEDKIKEFKEKVKSYKAKGKVSEEGQSFS